MKDITRNQTFLLLALFLGIYIYQTSFEVTELVCDPSEQPSSRLTWSCYDFEKRLDMLEKWEIQDFYNDFRHSVHFALLKSSQFLFSSYQILPFLSSIVILIMVFFTGREISQNNFGGFISFMIVLQSGIFQTYDTSITYPSFWALFFLCSIYFSLKKWQLSPIFYFVSIPSKILTIAFFPSLIAFFYMYNPIKRNKLLITFGIISFALSVLIFVTDIHKQFLSILNPDLNDFLLGFISWTWKGFVQDQFTLAVLITSGIILGVSVKRINNAKPVLVLFLMVVFSSPFIVGLAGEHYSGANIFPYRVLPIIVTGSLCTGLLISNYEKTHFWEYIIRMKKSLKN